MQYESDADGRFLYEHVPRDIDSSIFGQYQLLAAHEGNQASLDGMVRLPGQVHHVNLVFLGRGGARGHVRYDDGTPIAGVAVSAGSTLYPGWSVTETDENGFYELSGASVDRLRSADGQDVVVCDERDPSRGQIITRTSRLSRDSISVGTIRVRVLRSETMARFPLWTRFRQAGNPMGRGRQTAKAGGVRFLPAD